MCHSFGASIGAWILAFILSIFMLINSNVYGNWIPLFILTFSQIQILEAIIWSNGDQNSMATRLIVYFLLLQPLVNSLLGYVNTKQKILLYSTFVYLFLLGYHHITSKNDQFDSTIGPSGSLVWNRYHDGKKVNFFNSDIISVVYLIGLFLPFLFMVGNEKYIPIIVGLVTFIWNLKYNPQEFGSKWCYAAVSMAVIMLIYPLIKN